MKFKTYRIADISTCHITEKDGSILDLKDAPCHMAKMDDKMGDIYWVPLDKLQKGSLIQLKEFGFSKTFIKLMKALSKQKIPYVRFDADGALIKGAKKFDW